MAVNKEDLIEKFQREAMDDYRVGSEQADRANEDTRFVTVAGGQWEGFLPDIYTDDSKPKFELDKVSSEIYRYAGEWALNRPTVDYKADGGKATQREADILNGLYRKDMRRSGGGFAIDNGVLEAATGGVGAYRFETEFVDDDEKEQVINFVPICSAHSTVLWDSTAKRMDKADAKRCTLLHEFTKEAYEEKYPDNPFTSVSHHSDRRIFDFWNGKTTIIVAERYHLEQKKEDIRTYINPRNLQEETFWLSDIDLVLDEMKAEGFQLINESKRPRYKVMQSIYNGQDFIQKPKQIPGRYIPIIPIYGYWQYTDGQQRYQGIVRKRKDPQRLFNMEVSKVAESSATSPREVPIFDPEQLQDANKALETMWNNAGTTNTNFLLAKSIKDKAGNVTARGPAGYLKPPQIDQHTTALIQLTSQFIQEQGGGAPKDVLDPDASGKAINAQATRIDLNTYIIRDHAVSAIKWGGEVYRWIAADIHNHEKMVSVLNENGQESEVKLFDQMLDEETGQAIQINDITEGRYEVITDTGPGYESKRQATVGTIERALAVVTPDSPYFPVLMAMWVANVDGVGLEPLQKFNARIMLEMGIKEPENEEEEQLLEQINQAKQNPEPDPAQVLIDATAAKEQSMAELNKVKQADVKASAIKKMAEVRNMGTSLKLKKFDSLVKSRQLLN